MALRSPRLTKQNHSQRPHPNIEERDVRMGHVRMGLRASQRHPGAGCQRTFCSPAKGKVFSLDIPFYRTLEGKFDAKAGRPCFGCGYGGPGETVAISGSGQWNPEFAPFSSRHLTMSG